MDRSTVLRRGGSGREPGRKWTIISLASVRREAEKCLTESERCHLRDIISELAYEVTPSHAKTCSVDQVEDFYELREKGGPLGSKNVRVFFGLDDATKSIVLLGVTLKQNDGGTLNATKILMRNRWRKFVLQQSA